MKYLQTTSYAKMFVVFVVSIHPPPPYPITHIPKNESIPLKTIAMLLWGWVGVGSFFGLWVRGRGAGTDDSLCL